MLLLLLACTAPDDADDTAPETETDADTDADSDTDTDADSDADTDSDTDADTDSDTDADTDADTDSDTDADTELAVDGGGWSGATQLPGDIQLSGDRGGDAAGYSVEVADVTGDGAGDAIVAANAAGDEDFGRVYVVAGPVTGSRDLSDTIALEGIATGGLAGTALDAGDVNGGGQDDLVVGAPASLPDTSPVGDGAAYVVLGPITASGALSDAIAWSPEAAGSSLGSDVAIVGDVDGDGATDVAFGARNYGGYATDAGAVYLFGGSDLAGGSVADADARIFGASGFGTQYFGAAVAGLGDVDGDGVDDLAVSAPQYAIDGLIVGAVHVFLGPVTGDSTSSDADAAVLGLDAERGLAYHDHSLAGAGDVDGDGHADLLLGAMEHVGLSTSMGGDAYLVSGSALNGEVDLTLATWKVSGAFDDGYLGLAVGTAGDLDLDGFDDVLVSAPQDESYVGNGGAVYAFRGPLSGTAEVGAAAAAFYGTETNGYAGSSVAVGDLDDDGDGDLLIGARQITGGVQFSGGVFVVPGG